MPPSTASRRTAEQLGPVLSLLEPLQELDVQFVAAFEDVDRAQQVGKRVQVTAALQDKPRDDRWEVEDWGMLIGPGRVTRSSIARTTVSNVPDGRRGHRRRCRRAVRWRAAPTGSRRSRLCSARGRGPQPRRGPPPGSGSRRSRSEPACLARSAAWPLSRSVQPSALFLADLDRSPRGKPVAPARGPSSSLPSPQNGQRGDGPAPHPRLLRRPLVVR